MENIGKSTQYHFQIMFRTGNQDFPDLHDLRKGKMATLPHLAGPPNTVPVSGDNIERVQQSHMIMSIYVHICTYTKCTIEHTYIYIHTQLYFIDQYILIYPICSMYGIFTYIWVIFGVNVGKYSSTMEYMGICTLVLSKCMSY